MTLRDMPSRSVTRNLALAVLVAVALVGTFLLWPASSPSSGSHPGSTPATTPTSPNSSIPNHPAATIDPAALDGGTIYLAPGKHTPFVNVPSTGITVVSHNPKIILAGQVPNSQTHQWVLVALTSGSSTVSVSWGTHHYSFTAVTYTAGPNGRPVAPAPKTVSLVPMNAGGHAILLAQGGRVDLVALKGTLAGLSATVAPVTGLRFVTGAHPYLEAQTAGTYHVIFHQSGRSALLVVLVQ